MIRKIQIENVGLFKNSGMSARFAPATLIYGENGRGKSTVATVFRSVQLGEAKYITARKTIDSEEAQQIKIVLPSGPSVDFADNKWTAKLQNIIVFDSTFVEQNVYSGLEVRADQRKSLLEFALGDQTVQLKQAIDQLVKDIEAQVKRKTAAERILIGLSSPFSLPEFIALTPIDDLETKIGEHQKRLEAAKNAQALIDRKNPNDIALIEFDLRTVFEALNKEIEDLEKAAEATVREHLEKHSVAGLEDWISRGQQHINSNGCPFCGQAVDSNALLQAYRSYFSEAYAGLKTLISGLDKKVSGELSNSRAQALTSAVETNVARIEAWKDQFELTPPVLNTQLLEQSLQQARKTLLTLIGTKQRAPLEKVGSIEEADIVAAQLQKFNAEIGSYNEKIRVIVEHIEEFKKKLIQEDKLKLTQEIRKLEATQKRMQPKTIDLIQEYQLAEGERKTLDGRKKQARESLDKLMLETLQLYQESINSLLLKLGADFSIEQLKTSYVGGELRSEYGLKLRNKPVHLGSRSDAHAPHSFATTLSDGDKRTLAFAFFIARLHADPDLENRLIVMDDPVSSLDSNRRHTTIGLIVELATRCAQMIVLSHDAYFLRDLNEKLLDRKGSPLAPQVLSIKRGVGNYSSFSACDLDSICASQYYRHHYLLNAYVNGENTSNPREVATAIRPLLEGYCHRRFPGKIPRNLLFGRVIALASAAPKGEILASLHPIIKELNEINDYAGQFHHDTNPDFESASVVDAEVRSFAQRALNVIYG